MGTPRIELDGAPIQVERQKTLALLAYLAVTGQEHSRESLAAFFWPEAPQDRAFANLRRALWELNAALGNNWLTTGREAVGINRSPDLWIDATEFRALVEKVEKHKHANEKDCPQCAEWLSQAASLYEGEFLSGFNLKDSPSFDDWRFFQAEELRRSYVNALKHLAAWHERREDLDRSLEYSRKWAFIDPLDEEAHRCLMRLYALAGQRSAALHQYQECVRILDEELGAEPQEATRQLYEQIRIGQLIASVSQETSQPTSPQPNQSTPARFSNLPGRGTPFIGRAEELAEAVHHLRSPDCRLLTLLGPGGVGKTRLGLQAAEEIFLLPAQEGFTSGVFFVPLAHLTPSDSLIPAIAAALGLTLNTDEKIAAAASNPKDQLLDFLRHRQALLLMDNFEHMVDQAQLLSEILSSAKDIKILVTSRQRLSLQEEWALEVHGMSYPTHDNQQEWAGFEEFSAPALFVEVARRTRVNFNLSEGDRPCLARICQMVEGYPLGLELAASWTRMLTTCEIAQEISTGLDFLETPLRNLPERHRSLRAVFDHSWKLLSPQEQKIFQRLSIFQGGFSRKAAAEVAGASLAMLSSLADKSLIQMEGGSSCQNSGCYDLHVLVKQYAAEKLDAAPEEKANAQLRHAQYYCRLLADAGVLLKSDQQPAGIAKIRSEIDNLRQAWRYANENGMVEQVMQAALPLFTFYDHTGQYPEASQMFSLSVEALRPLYRQSPGNRDVASCLAFSMVALSAFLSWPDLSNLSEELTKESLSVLPASRRGIDYGTMALLLSSYYQILTREQANAFFEEILKGSLSSQDDWMQAIAYISWGEHLDAMNEELNKRLEPRLKALEIFTRIQNAPGMAMCLTGLAHFTYLEGDYQVSLDYSRRALELNQSIQDHWKIARTLLTLGQLAVARGEFAEARQYYLDSLDQYRNLGARVMIAVMLDCIGFTELHLGLLDSAEQRFWESNALYQQVDHRIGIAMSLVNLGDVALQRGDRTLAQQRYEQALEIIQDHEVLWEKMVCLRKLGSLAAERGEWAVARDDYKRALWIAHKESRNPEILDILMRYADLELRQGNREKACQLLAVCEANPALAQDTQNQINRLKERLGSFPSQVEKPLTLEQVIEELMQ